jgi:hypothetical protein
VTFAATFLATLRSRDRQAAAITFAWLIVLTGCAYVGNPKPPTLDIPSPVRDLRAIEYGDKILTEFTLPPLTTEGLPLENVRSIELRATFQGNAAGTPDRITSLATQGPGPVKADFPALDYVGKQVMLTVRATGPKGKTSEWSNAVSLLVGTPLATPTGLTAAAAPTGVQLGWKGAGPKFRVFRSIGELAPVRLDDTDKPTYLDVSAEIGMTYRYFVQAIDGETRQSEVSPTVPITPADTFPPAVPSGVSGVAGVDSVELAWERNTEPDFASYNIYRSENGGPFEKIASAIEAPTLSDRTVTAGRKYSYTVTAVDTTGNESARSMAADVTAQ